MYKSKKTIENEKVRSQINKFLKEQGLGQFAVKKVNDLINELK